MLHLCKPSLMLRVLMHIWKRLQQLIWLSNTWDFSQAQSVQNPSLSLFRRVCVFLISFYHCVLFYYLNSKYLFDFLVLTPSNWPSLLPYILYCTDFTSTVWSSSTWNDASMNNFFFATTIWNAIELNIWVIEYQMTHVWMAKYVAQCSSLTANKWNKSALLLYQIKTV